MKCYHCTSLSIYRVKEIKDPETLHEKPQGQGGVFLVPESTRRTVHGSQLILESEEGKDLIDRLNSCLNTNPFPTIFAYNLSKILNMVCPALESVTQ